MADVETKVEETTEVKADAPAEAKDKKKVDIDVDKLKGQAKEGVGKALNFVTEFFKADQKRSKLVIVAGFGLEAVLAFVAPGILPVIVGAVLAVVAKVGLDAAFPTEDKAEEKAE